jgi:hypothetical protein
MFLMRGRAWWWKGRGSRVTGSVRSARIAGVLKPPLGRSDAGAKKMKSEIQVYPAADQDGWDGGFIARVGMLWAWGATKREARKALVDRIAARQKKRGRPASDFST